MRLQKGENCRLGRGFGHDVPQYIGGQSCQIEHPRGAITISQYPAKRFESEHIGFGLNLPNAFRICFDHCFGLSESRDAA
jgi:hypothetical protein